MAFAGGRLRVVRSGEHRGKGDDGSDQETNDDGDDDESVVDTEMFRGMFELSMDMVESSGQLKVA